MECQSHNFQIGVIMGQHLHGSIWMHHHYSNLSLRQSVLYPTDGTDAVFYCCDNSFVPCPLCHLLGFSLLLLLFFLLFTMPYIGGISADLGDGLFIG